MEQFPAESNHGLQSNVAADHDVALLARLCVASCSELALLADQVEKFGRLLGDDDQREHHDQAIEHLCLV